MSSKWWLVAVVFLGLQLQPTCAYSTVPTRFLDELVNDVGVVTADTSEGFVSLSWTSEVPNLGLTPSGRVFQQLAGLILWQLLVALPSEKTHTMLNDLAGKAVRHWLQSPRAGSRDTLALLVLLSCAASILSIRGAWLGGQKRRRWGRRMLLGVDPYVASVVVRLGEASPLHCKAAYEFLIYQLIGIFGHDRLLEYHLVYQGHTWCAYIGRATLMRPRDVISPLPLGGGARR